MSVPYRRTSVLEPIEQTSALFVESVGGPAQLGDVVAVDE